MKPQQYNGRTHLIYPTLSLLAYTLSHFLTKSDNNHIPADLPAHLILRSHPANVPAPPVLRSNSTLPATPTRVALQPPSVVLIHSTAIAIASCVFLALFIVVLYLTRWSRQCAARSRATAHGKRSPPGCFSSHASRGEREESPGGEHRFSDLNSQSGDREDDEAGGDGDSDDDGYDQNGQTDELEEDNDAFSPFGDPPPPPPPNPPSQTTAADPDPKPKRAPLWYILFVILIVLKAFSILTWAIRRIRCSLKRIKVYTGKSVLNLFIYIEQPICGASTTTPMISSLGDLPGFDGPLWLEDHSSVQQAVELDNRSLWELGLSPMLGMAGVLVMLVLCVLLTHLYWEGKEVDYIAVLDVLKDHDIANGKPVGEEKVRTPIVVGVDLAERVVVGSVQGALTTCCRVLPTPAAIAVDVVDSRTTPSGSQDRDVDVAAAPIPKDVVFPASPASLAALAPTRVDVESSRYLDDSVLGARVQDNAASSNGDDARVSFLSGLGDIPVTDTRVEGSRHSNVRRGERDAPTPLQRPPTALKGPAPLANFAEVQCPLPLPKRVSELRRMPSTFFPQDTIFHSKPKHVAASLPLANVGISSPSSSFSRSGQKASVMLSDSTQLGSISGLGLGISGGRLSFAGELNQCTLVEPGAAFSGKVDVASKLHVAVEVEVVVLTGEGGVLEVVLDVVDVELLEVDEVGGKDVPTEEKDLQVVQSGDVVVDVGASFVDKSRLAVEEMLVEELHTSTLIPADVVTTRPDEDDSQEMVNFVDGAGIYRHVTLDLLPYSILSPVVLNGPAVPTSSPPVIYCPCCPGMELEWDESSIVDDVVAELQCYSLPYELDGYHLELAAQDDVDDAVHEGMDMGTWVCTYLVIDEEEELEPPSPTGADDTFDLSMILLDFYGLDGSKAELLRDVLPPDFDAADDIGVYYDFYSLLEEGWSFCLGPSCSSVVLRDEDLPSFSIECGLPTPDFAVVGDNTSDPANKLADTLRDEEADEVEDIKADFLTGPFVGPGLGLSCDEEAVGDGADVFDLLQVPPDSPDGFTVAELTLDLGLRAFNAVDVFGVVIVPERNRPAPLEDGWLYYPPAFVAAQDDGLDPPPVVADSVECDCLALASGIIIHVPSPVSSGSPTTFPIQAVDIVESDLPVARVNIAPSPSTTVVERDLPSNPNFGEDPSDPVVASRHVGSPIWMTPRSPSTSAAPSPVSSRAPTPSPVIAFELPIPNINGATPPPTTVVERDLPSPNFGEDPPDSVVAFNCVGSPTWTTPRSPSTSAAPSPVSSRAPTPSPVDVITSDLAIPRVSVATPPPTTVVERDLPPPDFGGDPSDPVVASDCVGSPTCATPGSPSTSAVRLSCSEETTPLRFCSPSLPTSLEGGDGVFNVVDDRYNSKDKRTRTWPWRRVSREAQGSGTPHQVQDTDDPARWHLRPVPTSMPPIVAEENEFQRMRARLRQPANMSEQERRVRTVWGLQGTEKGRALKERFVKKGRG